MKVFVVQVGMLLVANNLLVVDEVVIGFDNDTDHKVKGNYQDYEASSDVKKVNELDI